MPLFRKKPVVIEAFQLTLETRASNENWPEWLHKAWNAPFNAEGAVFCEIGVGDGPLFINTLEGKMTVSFGDWIIQGVKGELYPCKSDIFAATYDPV